VAATSYLRSTSHARVPAKVGGALRAGYGLPELHVGMTREECRAVFGDPDEVRSFKDGTFFQYLRLGFDLDFELGSKAKRLFFYRSGVQAHTEQCKVSFRKISFGSSTDEIKAALGAPSQAGRVGKKQWMLFGNGIQFDLDSRGRAEVIIVFRP
jgi:hypothetical protein